MRPYNFDEDFSTILLGGKRSPGVVTLSGHDRKDNWQISQAKGKTGASTTLNGPPPAQFNASFYLVDDSPDLDDPESQFDAWDAFAALIKSTVSGPTPFALPIYHPDLVANEITEVTRASIGGAVHDGKGGKTVVVTFLEYKPPKKKKAAAPSAKGASTTAGNAKPDPNAAAKAELAGLLAEAKKP